MTPSVETNVGTNQRRRGRETATPEETLARLRTENPDATAVELREVAWHYILENFCKSVAARNFTRWMLEPGLFRNIKEPPPPAAEQERARAQRIEQERQITETIARGHERKVIEAAIDLNIHMLEYETPYGKQLGDCTGAECDRLSRRYGDFFAELAKRITRSETVRAHLSETELQAIARTHRLIGEKAAR
jgi:hypothetical protein